MENNVDDQMEQVWRSKDGKCVGSKEEVEAYLASLSPLGKMRFPYSVLTYGSIQDSLGSQELAIPTRKALVAFANLAPLIHEALTAWNADIKTWRENIMILPENSTIQKLLLAYEEALKLVPR